MRYATHVSQGSEALIATLAAAIGSAQADEPRHGLFLCPSPVIANSFWNDVISAQQLGVPLDHKIALSIAQKDQCNYVASLRFIATNYVAGELSVADGENSGWVAPQQYVIYELGLRQGGLR